VFSILTDPVLKIDNQLSNLGVLHLAFTDLMTTSAVCVPAAITMLYDEYPFGHFLCGIWAVLNATGIVATMGFLMIISLDRFIVNKVNKSISNILYIIYVHSLIKFPLLGCWMVLNVPKVSYLRETLRMCNICLGVFVYLRRWMDIFHGTQITFI